MSDITMQHEMQWCSIPFWKQRTLFSRKLRSSFTIQCNASVQKLYPCKIRTHLKNAMFLLKKCTDPFKISSNLKMEPHSCKCQYSCIICHVLLTFWFFVTKWQSGLLLNTYIYTHHSLKIFLSRSRNLQHKHVFSWKMWYLFWRNPPFLYRLLKGPRASWKGVFLLKGFLFNE